MEKIFDEHNVEIDNSQVDLEKGYLSPDKIVIHHPEIEEVKEQSHIKVNEEYYEIDPETGDPILDPETGKKIVKGQDVERIIDVPYVPASPAWDESISILRYKLYTEEQLIEKARDKANATIANAQIGQRTVLNSLAAATIAKTATDQDILGITTFIPEYDSGRSYSSKECVIFEGVPYRALRTVPVGTSPDNSGYWARVGAPNSEGVYPWCQPISADDSYSIGDLVTFDGQTYISTVNYNVWSPLVYGWSLQKSKDSGTITGQENNWPDWKQPTGSTDSYSKNARVTYNGHHYISTLDNNVWQPGLYGWILDDQTNTSNV